MADDFALVFGIETTVRELDSRLVLASVYGCKNRRIFLAGGTSGQRVAEELRGALHVGKQLIHPRAENPAVYRVAKQNGSVMVHLAEEGAVWQGDEREWAWDLDHQLDPKLLSGDDYICTWGDFQRDHYIARGAPSPGNVRTTGHPRFGFLSTPLKHLYDDEVRALRAEYGKFVLFCSNFGFVNDPEGPWNTFSDQLGYDADNHDVLLRFLGRYTHFSKVFPEFITLIHKLAMKRRDVTIVVRPHPSDNFDFFRYAFRGVPNVKVTQQGSVVPWLMAARVLLHFGCTTALEAHLLGRPIVNFRPEVSNDYDLFLPNLVGTQTFEQTAAMDAIFEAVDSERPEGSVTANEVIPERAHRVFANFGSESVNAFLDVIRAAEEAARRQPRRTDRSLLIREELKAVAVEESKQLLRRVFSPRRYRTAKHGRQRFSGFSPEDITSKLSRLQRMTGTALRPIFHSRNIVELAEA